MDRIEFIRRPCGGGDCYGEIQIEINGRDLLDLVRAVENPFAYGEGIASLAGAYAGLPLNADTRPPSRHFLGGPADFYRYGSKTPVLGCECGEVGCWPLLCRIEVKGERVVWFEFEQPHRSGTEGCAPWTYDELGPFEFDRRQYVAALDALRSRQAAAIDEEERRSEPDR